MTWEDITTTFYKKYRNELNIDSPTLAYIQAKVLKTTLESLYVEAGSGEQNTEEEH